MSGSLRALWSARAVAVVGASARAGSLGRLPVEFLLRYGYTGRILPVNPHADEVLGLPAFPSVQACPGRVDLALVLVAAERVPAAVDDCAAAGVPVAIVGASGFAETGEQGARLQQELVDKARAGGVRLVGPNCIGAVGVREGLVASFSPLFSGERTELVPGSVAFVSQSGALGYGAVSLAFERRLGLGWVVNTGNEADVTALEVLTALAAEPDCTALLGYVETLRDGTALRRLAAAGKPVALLKAGRSEAGQRAAVSHTGALAAGDRVVDGALRQLGIVRVDDVDELLDVGDAFAQPRRPAGPRVAVVTTSGGSGILAADAVDQRGLTLAELAEPTTAALRAIVPAYGAIANPVDVTATVMNDPTLFDRALDAIAGDPGVDMVVACFCVLTGADVDAVVASLGRVAERTGNPVLAARTGADHLAPDAADALRAAGIPTYPTPARTVRAAAALWQVASAAARRRVTPEVDQLDSPGDQNRARFVRSVGHQVSQVDRLVAPAVVPAAPPSGATEVELKALLDAVGLPVPRGRVATDADDAAAAVTEVGGRAVLKAVVPGLLHKTEAGGVALDVTPESAAAAYDRLAALGGAVLVEEMVTGGVELLVGVAPSPLGQALTVGGGGVLTEVLDDVAVRLLPVGAADVRDMLAELRASALLSGVRGRPPADVDALVDLVVRLSDLVAGWPPGFELDLNPVVVLPAGARVLDAAYVAPAQGAEG